MSTIFGSRRGRPLLPLPVQWGVFVLCAAWSVSTVISWARATSDTYPHEHARLAMLAVGVTLLAASGLVRRNRPVHVGLFAAGGACLVISTLLRFAG